MPKEAMHGISFELFEEVFGVACCANCKNYFIYRVQEVNRTSKVNGDKKSVRSFKTLHGFVRRELSLVSFILLYSYMLRY